MKGDFSRLTFRRAKHYSGVRQQQGRVQLDADWNEQADIEAYRDRTTALDVMGPTGAPIEAAGFTLTCAGGDIGAGCKASAIRIGAGRYYVAGILCENDAEVPIEEQPDLPGVALTGTAGNRYLVYLDVWQQHISSLEQSPEEESIREAALGGPDTTTRLKTVWQVKVAGPVSTPCSAFGPGWTPPGAVADGTMAAQAEQAAEVASDCLVPAGAGYRRLDNQLYRVEIRDSGTALAWPRPAATVAAGVTVTSASRVKIANVSDWSLGGWPWLAGQVVEVFSPATDGANAVGPVGMIVAADEANRTLELDADLTSLVGGAGAKVRRVATFVWSRDNGSILAGLTAIDPVTSILTVSHPNRDALSGFAAGQWVELSDRGRSLRGEPGLLVELSKVQGTELTVRAWPGGTAASLSGFDDQPTVRRWDSAGALAVAVGQFLDLEGGVQVQFGGGSFRSGDYWTVPARSLTHEVEWPRNPVDATTPALLAPEGVEHRFAALAQLQVKADGVTWQLAGDCRRLFPPLTGLLSLTYLGGDGQEIAPNLTGLAPVIPGPLPEPLRVRVANGRYPVKGATARFAVAGNLGDVNGVKIANVLTDEHGVASGSWTLDPRPGNPVQHVVATLLDDTGQPSDLPPIRFTANLSIAGEVAFDTQVKKCQTLAAAATVQDAVDTLSTLTTLTSASGDGQEAMPGQGLPQPLRVLAGNDCGPLQEAKVLFEAPGNGRVAATLADLPGSTSTTMAVTTGPDGIAACVWQPDRAGPTSQQLLATLTSAGPNPTAAPTTVLFTANLSVAAAVAYTPTCEPLAGADTVQQAIDILCTTTTGRDPGVHVERLTLVGPPESELRNDSAVPVGLLSGGIHAHLDRPVDPIVKGNPVMIVTIDLPFPFTQPDVAAWQVAAIGTVPVTLAAAVAEVGPGILSWEPNPKTAAWLRDKLFQILTPQGFRGVLAHLVIKGNFIWADGDPRVSLDGEVFGFPEGGRKEVNLPSGDGRRGGDLEMWFTLREG
jgi:hypothetical protein